MRDFFFLSKSKHSGPSARQILSNNTTFKQKTLPLSCTPSGKFSDIWVMGDGWLRYSVLSTYEKTWFMYRHFDNPGQLFISDCIEQTSTDPTLLRCFLYMVYLSGGEDNHWSPAPPQSSSPSPPHGGSEPSEGDNSDQGPNDRRRRQRGTQRCSTTTINVKQYNWGEIDLVRELGHGRCGTVYEAILHGDRVATKIGDIWKYPKIEDEMMNKAKIYMLLEKLQGIIITKLKEFGYTGGGLLALSTDRRLTSKSFVIGVLVRVCMYLYLVFSWVGGVHSAYRYVVEPTCVSIVMHHRNIPASSPAKSWPACLNYWLEKHTCRKDLLLEVQRLLK